MRRHYTITAMGVLLTTIFASYPALALTASFRWCSGSPEFKISNVPKGTVKLSFNMIDQQVPSYHHGGGEIVYSGQATIPCGAMNGTFESPSPPPPEVHTYQWTIKAVDKSGAVLATTTASKKFPVK